MPEIKVASSDDFEKTIVEELNALRSRVNEVDSLGQATDKHMHDLVPVVNSHSTFEAKIKTLHEEILRLE